MFGTTVYELPLARDYVRHWGVAEGVRELIQNAIDSESAFEFQQGLGTLALTSRGARLDRSTLVLGRTSKADRTDAIGSFGEGYKLALLVLTREKKPVRILNQGREWRPEFRRSRQFDTETLHIVDTASETPQDGVTFLVEGLTGEEQDAIVESCLLMQEPMLDIISTEEGDILPSKPGKLYVGGLFICTTELAYGYDIKPAFINLERDRQTVDGFNLLWITRQMWFNAKRPEFLAEMIEAGVKDVELCHLSAPEMVKEACYRHFQAKHPGAIAVTTQEELDRLVERGMTNTVYVNSTYHSTVTSSRSYAASGVAVRQLTPAEELQGWYDANKKYMPRLPQVALKHLIEKASTWRLK